MAQFLDSYARFIDAAPWVFVAYYLGLLIWRAAIRRTPLRLPIEFGQAAAAAGVASFVLMFLLAFIEQKAAGDEVARVLSHSQGATVAINNKTLAYPEPILAALRSMHPIPLHHSYSTTFITVSIRLVNGESESLILGRQDDDSQEYAVYAPRYSLTSPSGDWQIASIETSLLNEYK
jgi:hypothetical protein